MANIEINGLPLKATPLSTDEIVVQATGGGLNEKTTLANVKSKIVLDSNGELAEQPAGAAAEVAAGRTNSVKRADGTWSARVRNLPADYALQTWADDLAIGAYSVNLTVAQNGLPAGWWYIEVMRHAGDSIANQYRHLRATPLNWPLATRPVYHCSDVNSTWSAWTPVGGGGGGGKLLQLVSFNTELQGSQALAADTPAQVQNMALSITPKGNNSLFFITIRWFGEIGTAAYDTTFNILRNGSAKVNMSNASSNHGLYTIPYYTQNDASTPECINFGAVDKAAASTTGTPITYNLVVTANANAKTLWQNRCFSALTGVNYEIGSSEIVIMEVAP